MKALATQFDNRRLSNAVATPTCSSCCCCCCCLATSVASSTLLAQRINKEAKIKGTSDRTGLTLLAALFAPVVGLLVYFGFWGITRLVRTCTEYASNYGGGAYQVCTNPSSLALVPLLIIAPFLVLTYLYSRVRMTHPVRRALLVTILIAICFAAEFIGGAVLILTGVGGIVYIILVPIIVGWITVWYHKHLGKERAAVPIQNSPLGASWTVPGQEPASAIEPTTPAHEEPPTSDPTQQNPPAANGQ